MLRWVFWEVMVGDVWFVFLFISLIELFIFLFVLFYCYFFLLSFYMMNFFVMEVWVVGGLDCRCISDLCWWVLVRRCVWWCFNCMYFVVIECWWLLVLYCEVFVVGRGVDYGIFVFCGIEIWYVNKELVLVLEEEGWNNILVGGLMGIGIYGIWL